jgi:hypothetical protein
MPKPASLLLTASPRWPRARRGFRVMTTQGFEPFATWREVLEYVNANGSVYYQPPLNHRPVWIAASVGEGGKLKMYASRIDRDADDFTADESHLDRMRKRSLPLAPPAQCRAGLRRCNGGNGATCGGFP